MIKVISFTKEELKKMLEDEVVYGVDFQGETIQYMSRERLEEMLVSNKN